MFDIAGMGDEWVVDITSRDSDVKWVIWHLKSP